ncbi:MAG: RES domain-containing protein [Candidatus Sericytochromatia bacterium]|nr:RES domain-containing protein [Candidatus Sericytochromatia bacterium]
MRLWRLAPASQAKVLDGVCSKTNGSHWTSPGLAVLVTAERLTLAALETAGPRLSCGQDEGYMQVLIDVPVGRILSVSRQGLPGDWEQNLAYTRSVGDRWLLSCVSLMLRVPSSMAGNACNVLINPDHADHQHVRILEMAPFGFDLRLDAA